MTRHADFGAPKGWYIASSAANFVYLPIPEKTEETG